MFVFFLPSSCFRRLTPLARAVLRQTGIRYIERVTSGGGGTPSKPAVLVLSTGSVRLPLSRVCLHSRFLPLPPAHPSSQSSHRPHWANGRFAGAGQTEELKPERLLGMYERSVSTSWDDASRFSHADYLPSPSSKIKSLFQRLEPIESVIPIFRTTAQGTPSCWIYSKENSHPANATQRKFLLSVDLSVMVRKRGPGKTM